MLVTQYCGLQSPLNETISIDDNTLTYYTKTQHKINEHIMNGNDMFT